MPCERVGPYIVCSRGRKKAPLCSVCGARPATQLCDGPAPPGRGPSPRSKLPAWVEPTCDAPLCTACSVHVTVTALPDQFERAAGVKPEPADRDFCPRCAGASPTGQLDLPRLP